MLRTCSIPVATLVVVLQSSSHPVAGASAAGRSAVVADTTDAAPDGDGIFSQLSAAALNDAGQVGFFGLIGEAAGGGVDFGLYRGQVGSVVRLARQGQSAPDGDGSFSFLAGPILNDAGVAAFRGDLVGTSGGTRDGSGIFLGDGAAVTTVARDGQLAPGGSGRIMLLDGVVPTLNGVGQTAFRVELEETNGGLSSSSAVFRGAGTSGSLVEIAREDQPSPDGNGTLGGFQSTPTINDVGQVGFRAFLRETADSSLDDEGVFRSDAINSDANILVQIAREGEVAPNGVGVLSGFDDPSVNEAGQLVFRTFIDLQDGGSRRDEEAVFRGDGEQLIRVARTGQGLPNDTRNDVFSGFGRPSLNDAGTIAFSASIDFQNDKASFDSRGIFRSDGTLVEIARRGQPAPTTDGQTEGILFDLPLEVALNNRGQVAFSTDDAFGDAFGIFLFDDAFGLVAVVRVGDAFDGSTVADLRFSPGLQFQEEGSGLNNLGQVAYGYTLNDGRSGVAIWTLIPEPTVATVFYGLSLAALQRPRRRQTASVCSVAGFKLV